MIAVGIENALVWVEPRWRELGLRGDCTLWLERCGLPLAEALTRRRSKEVLIAGVSGAQGTGKSSACQLLLPLLEGAYGLRTLVLSLDDFYLSKAARVQLAAEVHPLFATRGVPGTHDIGALHACLRALRAADGGSVFELPRFSKALDDRSAEVRRESGRFAVVLLEGWCVGAQLEHPGLKPCNALEAEEDPDGTFRRYVNQRLATDYAVAFAELDALVFFAAPDMQSVYAFRREQEEGLRRAGLGGMSDAQLERFVMHFERITVQMLREVPAYADVVVQLDRHRAIVGFSER